MANTESTVPATTEEAAAAAGVGGVADGEADGVALAAAPEPAPEEAKQLIDRLVRYGQHAGLVADLDVPYVRNALLDLFRFQEPAAAEAGSGQRGEESGGQSGMHCGEDSGGQSSRRSGENSGEELLAIIEPLLDYGAAIGLIPDDTLTYRDLLDARIMGLLMPRPAEVAAQFARLAAEAGIAAATSHFYAQSIASNYIRMDRVSKNQYWLHPTAYGSLEMTVNLSKPEKDPREIALLRSLPPRTAQYPRCLLCADNVGYAGRPDHPARQNLRVLPLELQGEQWYFQYSPYVYYNEHSIVFKGEHVPMVISEATFARLLDFVDQFPHYFIGSNADLPIVGGSILNHDHFQAGRHTFPMETAPIEAEFVSAGVPGVTVGIVQWPMSVLRVRAVDKAALLQAASGLLAAWREYSDEAVEVRAYSPGPEGGEPTPHNTITPIARLRESGEYELDLVLRNNRTNSEHPDGIFHPHANLHHIKKENIGLIEVMGLAVLPGRLKSELQQAAAYLAGEAAWDAAELAKLAEPSHPLHKHAEWIAGLVGTYGTSLEAAEALQVAERETGNKFLEVLQDAGVFKRDAAGQAAFRHFLAGAGYAPVE